jgi:hypothetical protein
MRARRLHFHFSSAKLPHEVFYVSPLLPALFLPRAPRLQAASSREIVHMQAGQSGSQMGTEFYRVLCDEHGIGGDGEYYSDNDTQLGRIYVLYHMPRAASTYRARSFSTWSPV